MASGVTIAAGQGNRGIQRIRTASTLRMLPAHKVMAPAISARVIGDIGSVVECVSDDDD
jgi:hypothetical protein